MKRAIRIAVISLLLGAAINVAVAWGCALWSPCDPNGNVEPIKSIPIGFHPPVPTEWLTSDRSFDVILAFSSERSIGLRLDCVYAVEMDYPSVVDPCRGVVIVRRAGWPLPSLRCDAVIDAKTVGGVGLACTLDPGSWHDGITAPGVLHPRGTRSALPELRPIPLGPIWPGFAINTLVYGVAGWTLLGGPFTVRRWRRARRGLCVTCGYPVRGLGTCPECGKEVSGPSADARGAP